jgi:hypothetical protein
MANSHIAALGLATPLLLALLPGPAAAQETPQIRVVTRAAEISIGGRVQTQFSTSSVDDAVPVLWEMRRVRPELGVRLNPLISARLNPEFAGSQIALRDAFVQFDFSPGFQLLAGQAFRPFSLLAQTSSVRILPIERGARIRGLSPTPLEHYNLLATLGYAERDVGFQVRGAPTGAPLGWTYAAGVFNGPAIAQAGNRATYQLSARTTTTLAPDLRLGLAWSRRDFVGRPTAGADTALRQGAAWQADLEIGTFARGPHLMAEVATGALDPFSETRRRFRAAQLWAAYRTRPAGPHAIQLEPIARVSYGDPDATDADRALGLGGGTLLTPGINLYFGPLNRIMLNYDHWSPAGDRSSEHSLRAQFQIAF